ncbi:MAG: MBG domain-containing protein [Mucilaginibacter sp.]
MLHQKPAALIIKYILTIGVCLALALLPLLSEAQTDQTVTAGSVVPLIVFPTKGCVYDWTSSNPAIGIAANGTGNIPSFTAINNSNIPVTATITATPRALNYAYVTNTSSNTVSVLNTVTNTVNNTISNNIGIDPDGIGITPDGSKIYIDNGMSGTISVSSTAANNPAIGAMGVSSSTSGTIAFSPDGTKAYSASTSTNQIIVIDAIKNFESTRITVGTAPTGVAISPDGARLYVVNAGSGNVSVINTTTNAVMATVTTGTGAAGVTGFITVSPDGSRVYVSNVNTKLVYVIDTSTNLVIASIPIGSEPRGLVVSPDGSKLYIANTANTVLVINTVTNAVLSSIPVGLLPNGVLLSVDGSTLYVVNSNSNNVSVINTAINAVVTTISVGLSPDAIAGIVSSNCNSSPITFTITVNPPSNPIITETGVVAAVNTVYGTPSNSSGFTVSGTNMTGGIVVTAPAGFEVSTNNINFAGQVTVAGTGAIAATPVYIRLKATTAAGSYTGNIVLSSAGANNVNVTMPLSVVSPLPLNILVFGTKYYGATITDFIATPANFDFSPISVGLRNGDVINYLQITLTGAGSPTTPVGYYSNVVNSSMVAGTNGFLTSNYIITYQSGYINVVPAPLTITANNVNKPYGTTLTGGTGSSGYTVTGLQNAETINSVTLSYSNGSAANAAPGTYPGTVMPSGVVGANGFLNSNYAITYVAGNIVVGPESPTINASGNLSPLTTVYGTPSPSSSFMVSGINMNAPISITPPPGFEESLDNASFTSTLSVGTAGNIGPFPVYIRLKATTFVGSYTGNIVLSSPGATSVNVLMPPSTVTPAKVTVTARDATKSYGSVLTGLSGSSNFTVSGLQNSETAGSVTITYGLGSSASANAGTYAGSVVASALTGGNFTATNYNIYYSPGNLAVTPVPLTIIADNKTRVYGIPNPTFTATYTGFLNSDSPGQLTTLPAIYTLATPLSPPGDYQIEISGAVSSNYIISYVTGILTVTPAGLPITIPNTFTPNGDGINDTWIITNLNSYPLSHIEIFNRYGTLLYLSNGYPVPWNGKYKGQDLPDGTYYYVISFGGGKKPLSGYVSIIR